MLRFFELAPSPNNLKVRLALRFKGIPFEAVAVDAFDRSHVIEASGQELTPVISDRGIVLNDSEAILHYLDANYRGRPRLAASDRAGRKECDAWKSRLDREVASHWAPVFFSCIGVGEPHTEEQRRAFADALKRLEDELGGRETFHPDLPVFDLRVAEWALYAFPGDGLVERVPLFGKFREAFGIDGDSLPGLLRVIGPWNPRSA